MIKTVDIVTKDIRFPTSKFLDGSDSMNPDYYDAHIILKTDHPSGYEGHGLTFTIGRGIFIFDVQEVFSYISKYMTLLPSDIISTGTPFGVGLGLNPLKQLVPGDIIELGIECLEILKQSTKSYSIR